MADDEMTALIKRAQAGDRRAFTTVLEAHYDTMFKFAHAWCRNTADAEDITQTACIKLAQALSGFRFKSKFSSWLYTLVIHTAIDWQRQNRKEKTVGAVEDLEIAAPDNTEDATHARALLRQVDLLPEKEKAALLLVFSEGLNHAEAARVMNCKESTVSWYIHEARKKLGVTEDKKERRHG